MTSGSSSTRRVTSAHKHAYEDAGMREPELSRIILDEVGSMSELGIQFARAYGAAPETMLHAELS